MALTQAIGSWIHGRAELGRALAMLFVFRPAAYLLPMFAIHWLALVLSVPLVLAFAQNRYVAREFADAFGVSLWSGVGLAVRSYASKFVEFSLQQKYAAGLRRWPGLPIRIEANEEAQRLIAGDGPLVLAQSHFVRNDALAAVLVPETFKRRMVFVALRPPAHKYHPHAWRIRVQLSVLLASAQKFRPHDFSFLYVGAAAFTQSLAALEVPRTLVTINVDAHWKRGKPTSITRPYAGALERTFATGGARLARVAKVPLLLALPRQTEDGREIRMRVFGPYTSNLSDPVANDADVTGQMLDEIEREIGRRPTDYVLAIGGERHWDAATGTWSVRASSVAARAGPVHGVTAP